MVYSASIVRECDAVLFRYRSWNVFFLPGSWVQTQVESPPKMSEIFYDLPCKNLFKFQNNYFEGGEGPIYSPLKSRTGTLLFQHKAKIFVLRLMSSSGGTEGYLRQ